MGNITMTLKDSETIMGFVGIGTEVLSLTKNLLEKAVDGGLGYI